MTVVAVAKDPEPKPIIKCAGGKTKLLPDLMKLIPGKFGRYFEPFAGGAALFFEVKCWMKPVGLVPRAVLADNNPDIVNLYSVVRDSPQTLILALRERYHTKELVYAYNKDQYAKIRALDPATMSPVSRAARFMYLNKTCFNGLWRVNKQGRFNVPMGKYKNPVICDEKAILAASRAFHGVELVKGDFEDALNVYEPKSGDVVYFDPPYDPLSDDSEFTSYTSEGFEWLDQVRLYARASYLAKKGVTVIASNADTKRIRDLWKGFEVTEVLAARAINSRTEKRGKITELIFHNMGKG